MPGDESAGVRGFGVLGVVGSDECLVGGGGKVGPGGERYFGGPTTQYFTTRQSTGSRGSVE